MGSTNIYVDPRIVKVIIIVDSPKIMVGMTIDTGPRVLDASEQGGRPGESMAETHIGLGGRPGQLDTM